jgi:hypothetical protein
MLKRDNFIGFILLCVFVLFAFGCTFHDTSLKIYEDRAIGRKPLNTAIILPLQCERLLVSEKMVLNENLINAFFTKNKGIKLVIPKSFTIFLKDKGMEKKYTEFIKSYKISGIFDSSFLLNLKKELKADAVLLREVKEIIQKDGIMINEEPVFTSVIIKYSLISTVDGKILWEARSKAIVRNPLNIARAPKVMDAMLIAQRKLLKALPVF